MFSTGATGLLGAGESGLGAALVGGRMVTRHRPIEGSLHPVRATRPSCATNTIVKVYITVHLLSVRQPVYISDLDVKYGKQWMWRDAAGSLVRGGEGGLS